MEMDIKLEDTTPIICEKCNNDVFIQGVFLRKASKFLTGTKEDALVPIPTFVCAVCSHVNDGFRPKSK